MSFKNNKRYRIKDLSEIAEVSRRAVRYYIQRGLLAPPNGAGRGSYYTSEHLEQLLALKKAQEKGYSLEEIEELQVNKASNESIKNDVFQSSDSSQADSFSTGASPSAYKYSLLPSPSLSSPPIPERTFPKQILHFPPPSSPTSSLSPKPFPLDESQSLSTWIRFKVDEQIEVHLKEGALSSSELKDFQAHILDFFSSLHLK